MARASPAAKSCGTPPAPARLRQQPCVANRSVQKQNNPFRTCSIREQVRQGLSGRVPARHVYAVKAKNKETGDDIRPFSRMLHCGGGRSDLLKVSYPNYTYVNHIELKLTIPREICRNHSRATPVASELNALSIRLTQGIPLTLQLKKTYPRQFAEQAEAFAVRLSGLS